MRRPISLVGPGGSLEHDLVVARFVGGRQLERQVESGSGAERDGEKGAKRLLMSDEPLAPPPLDDEIAESERVRVSKRRRPAVRDREVDVGNRDEGFESLVLGGGFEYAEVVRNRIQRCEPVGIRRLRLAERLEAAHRVRVVLSRVVELLDLPSPGAVAIDEQGFEPERAQSLRRPGGGKLFREQDHLVIHRRLEGIVAGRHGPRIVARQEERVGDVQPFGGLMRRTEREVELGPPGRSCG